MRLLLVEDEIKLSDALKYLLEKENIKVDVANDGDIGLFLARQQIYDVLVLDIMLPGRSGIDILRTIRNEGITLPVLILTAKDAVEDRVKGLNLGADDYLVKPFEVAELIARIKSLYRRHSGDYTSNSFTMGEVEYIKDSYVLKVGSKEFNVSAKEGELLEMFMKRPGQIFTKEQIINRVWGYEADITENNVEVLIYYLRKKLEGSNIKIKTVRNAGYKIIEV